MARRKPSKPYRGILTAPATKPDPDLSKVGNAFAWTGTAFKKLDALLDHYGIGRNVGGEEKWFLLALNLAAEYVPGFAPQFKHPQGRQASNGSLDIMLYLALRTAELSGESVANMARHLSENHPRFKGRNAGSLRERYYKLKDAETPEGKRLLAFVDWLNRDEDKVVG